MRFTIPLSVLSLAACSQDLDGPDPDLSARVVEPALVCVEEITTTVTIDGEGLSPTVFDSLTDDERVVLPQIDLQRTADLQGNAVTEDPIRVPDDEASGLVRWIDDTRMEFDITSELGLEPGVYDITVTNPDGSQAVVTDAFGGVDRPFVDEIVPEHMCLAQGAQSFQLHGGGFLLIDGVHPTVDVGGQIYEAEMLNDCNDLEVPLDGVQICATAAVTVPQDDLPLGMHDVVLTNPEPAGCSSSEPKVLEITAPPDITSVAPLQLCTGGGTLTIGGTDFNERATVLVGGVPAFQTDFVSDTELGASFGALGLDPGTYSVTVEQDGCSDTFETDVSVDEGIVTFFVDPPIVFNGIETRVTIFVSGLDAAPSKVALIDESGQETDLSGSIEFTDAGEVQVVVPTSLATGTYDVLVDDGSQCSSILPDGLTVTDQDILALESIDPPFGHTDADTAVEIRADESASELFAKTPRAYLSPTGGNEASQIESVAFVSETLLTGVVPAGLPVGTYDVIVVNPTGEVGVLGGAFEVTEDPPPEITEVSPGSLESSATPQPTTVFGNFFRSPSVELTCRLPDDSIETPNVSVDAVRDAGTDENDGLEMEIDISVTTDGLPEGTFCVVKVTNDDGTFAEFSGITITNPTQAQNPIAFSAGESMNTARRAPATAAGRATSAARFVYAIGGDGGDVNNRHATVEAAPVDRFGDLGAWFTLPVTLPEGRTLTRAVTLEDRFIYVVGGNVDDGNNAGPTASALRTKILDPAERPDTPDPSLALEDTGLEAGVWYYRLSAVVAEDATQDPGGGEILASDPRVIQIPDLDTEEEVQVTLTWPSVPDAVEYRLYRTPMPDMASGDELLLATIDAPDTSFTDDGSITPSGDAPLPLGSTGAWEALGDLNDARQGHGLTVAPDPASADVLHLYAVGGEDGAGKLASVERLGVTLVAGGQTPAVAWDATTIDLPIGTERSGLQAVTAHGGTASNVGDAVWVYALGGDGDSALDASVHAAEVQAGGALLDSLGAASWEAVSSMSPARSGYAAAVANNFIYALGGVGTFTTGDKANICGPDDVACDPPEFVAGWNSLSDIMMDPRALMGQAVQSSTLYLIGGVDDNGNVLATTEHSVLGGQP